MSPMKAFASRQLGAFLVEEGVLPKELLVSDIEVHIPVDGIVMLRCDILMTSEQLAGLQRAIGRFIAAGGITP